MWEEELRAVGGSLPRCHYSCVVWGKGGRERRWLWRVGIWV